MKSLNPFHSLKFIISHPGKQYVVGIISVLRSFEFKILLFSTIVSNKLNLWQSVLPSKVRDQLSKRYFSDLSKDNIIHYPWLLLLFRLSKKNFSLLPYKVFDLLVAWSIRKKEYDIIITYENSNLRTHQQAKKSGKITILDFAQIHHNDILECMSLFGTPKQITYERDKVNPQKEEALRYTDYVFCLSDYAKASLEKNGFQESRIFKLSLGVDMQRFTGKAVYRYGGNLELIFVGTIMRRKGLELVTKAYRELQNLSIHWTVIGPPGDAMDVLPLDEAGFTYHPFMDHQALVEQYQKADVFVFPSYLDSWAQTVIEAMACGTPVIVSDNTGAKEAVAQGGGFVVPTGDVDTYVEKILYFYHNRDDIETMGRQARKVAEQYTWENYHRQVHTALKEIAKRENIAW